MNCPAKLLLLIILFASNSGILTAQSASASASASATIVTPITISKNQDINFGNLDVQSLNGGKVVLSPEGMRSTTNGVSLPSNGGTATAADFTVMGSSACTYAIELPGSVILNHSSGSETMIASAFTSSPSGTGLLTGGTQHVKIGATLEVSASQRPGTYTSQLFEITVNYN